MTHLIEKNGEPLRRVTLLLLLMFGMVIAVLGLQPQTAHAAAPRRTQYRAQVKPKKYSYVRKAYGVSSSVLCSCVTYAKQRSGINVGPVGYAKNHPINSHVPKVGSIMVMHSGWTGHLAVVTAVKGNLITITEANWKHCQQSTRTLNANNPSIRGYYAS